MEGLTIRPLRDGDAAAIGRITQQSPEAALWSPASYSGCPGWVAETVAGAVVGFVAVRTAADEMEILNLAIEPASRRRGLGSVLLAATLEFGRRAGARCVFLEVRESNRAARRFYERHGFAVVGRRPRYYRDPEEDALLMALSPGGSP